MWERLPLSSGTTHPNLLELAFVPTVADGVMSTRDRYVKNTFDPASASTIGASFLAKKVVVDDCLVRLQVQRLLYYNS